MPSCWNKPRNMSSLIVMLSLPFYQIEVQLNQDTKLLMNGFLAPNRTTTSRQEQGRHILMRVSMR